MFNIDENSFRLLKMTESLLKAGKVTEENLGKYQDNAKKIDKLAFDKLIEMIKDIENHSQSLEEEVTFLEEILNLYNQLDEMQHLFRSVYNKYSDGNLELSNISLIDIDALNERISTINGYLINLKNIDENKKELEELSQQLIFEDKKKNILAQRLLQYDEDLRESFINAEGRTLVGGEIE